ncbi:two-component sensor histidine kinase [Synechococcus elongatus PCC 6301]|uniref:histidine kinase n=1 Tax=Synechococcus sp. (strain ATCC 27144 / PCC 6301 / SAUG 1402/1) TaxID=269084 RepID=A0A0H3K522_SYNP6|nr:HAMP domain-containing sensor histidine kinase [Synechococcus elongatus]BAD78233.1 two-component sensor histidine kinase [Synechococcus elongatus PCC 6301]
MSSATRRRLAIWYTLLTAILLLAFAVSAYVYARGTLIDRVDDTLSHVVEVIERSLVIEPTGPSRTPQVNLEISFRSREASAEADRIDLEWFSPSGDLLWSTLDAPLAVPLSLSRRAETVSFPSAYDEPALVRQLTEPVIFDRQLLGYLRVSHPWFEVSAPIQQLLIDLSFGSALMLVAVAATGWFLSGLAMRPVYESYGQLKQFTADASHELRNPIATIQANVQAALTEPQGLAPEQQQVLQVIERLTRRLGSLVDDLLFLARQDSGLQQPAPIQNLDLDALLLDVVEEQSLYAQEQNLSLDLQLPDADQALQLTGVREQLARLFTNLIANALQYTPASGQVTVQVQPLNQGLQVEVRDSGIGISPETLPHVFERFYRADPARRPRDRGGSGLGLAIAQAIVERHHGKIHLRSQVGQGTTAVVWLPFNQPDAARSL